MFRYLHSSSWNTAYVLDLSLQRGSLFCDLAILFLPVFMKALFCGQNPVWYSQSKAVSEWDKWFYPLSFILVWN